MSIIYHQRLPVHGYEITTRLGNGNHETLSRAKGTMPAETGDASHKPPYVTATGNKK